MSRAGELLKVYRPAGVPFRAVGDVTAGVAVPGKVKRQDYALGSLFPIVDQSVDFIAGYTDEENIVLPADEYVIFGDHTRAVKFVNFAFAQGADGVKVLKPAAGLSARWLYYCLANLRIPSRGYNRHWTVLREMRIPVPPVEVQAEIVRILDVFTELGAALEEERAARRTQFAHYRDELLAFTAREDVPLRPMSEVGSFIRGRRFTKEDVVIDGIASIHYGEIYTGYGVSAHEPLSRVRPDLQENLRFATAGDVVIAGVGETVEDVAKAVAWLGDEDVAIHDDCFAFRHKLNPRFVAYYFQTARFHAQKNRHVARAKVKRISSEGLGKILMPVPDTQEQDRIVAVLDKFDTLLNDPSIGLPAEIDLRRSQYEHYRDRMLAFEEAVG